MRNVLALGAAVLFISSVGVAGAQERCLGDGELHQYLAGRETGQGRALPAVRQGGQRGRDAAGQAIPFGNRRAADQRGQADQDGERQRFWH